jgi:hypothetical protein
LSKLCHQPNPGSDDLVAVVRWIENGATDGFVKRLLAAVAAKS